MSTTNLLIELDVDRETAWDILQSSSVSEQFDVEERLMRAFPIGDVVNLCLVLKPGLDAVAAAASAANALKTLFDTAPNKHKVDLKVRIGQKESVTEIGGQFRRLEKSCLLSLDFRSEPTPTFETDTTNTMKLLREAKQRAQQGV